MNSKIMLFENNIVNTRIMGAPTYGALILPISEIHSTSASFWVPYDDSNTWENETHSIEHLTFIPLDFKELFTALGIEKPKNIPPHIKYFNELQNWYFFVHGKPFVDIEKLYDKDGDLWIELSKEFRKFCGVEGDYRKLVENYNKEER